MFSAEVCQSIQSVDADVDINIEINLCLSCSSCENTDFAGLGV